MVPILLGILTGLFALALGFAGYCLGWRAAMEQQRDQYLIARLEALSREAGKLEEAELYRQKS